MCGVALFVNATLVACDLIQADNTFLLGKHVHLWWVAQRSRFALDDRLSILVTENQQVYPGARSANPNDLLPLAYLNGAVHARIDADETLMPLPRVWKGSVEKSVFTRRILAKLQPDELSIVKGTKCAASKLHNVVDAVGLGLYAIGSVRPVPGYTEVV